MSLTVCDVFAQLNALCWRLALLYSSSLVAAKWFVITFLAVCLSQNITFSSHPLLEIKIVVLG